LLFPLKSEVGLGGGMVIDHANTRFLEAVEDGTVEFHESPVLPKGAAAGAIQSKATGHFREQVVTIRIPKIAGADFCLHIPTAERSGGETHASDLQQHIGDRRNGVPTQLETVQVGTVGVADGEDHGLRQGRREKPGWAAWQGND